MPLNAVLTSGGTVGVIPQFDVQAIEFGVPSQLVKDSVIRQVGSQVSVGGDLLTLGHLIQPTGAMTGFVLTSDSNGVGSWQASPVPPVPAPTSFYMKRSIPPNSAPTPSVPILFIPISVLVPSVFDFAIKFGYRGSSGNTFTLQIDGVQVFVAVSGAGSGTNDLVAYLTQEEFVLDWLDQNAINPATGGSCPPPKERFLSPGSHVITLVWHGGYCDGSFPGGIGTIYGGTAVLRILPLV